MIHILNRQTGVGKAGRGFKSPTLVKTCEETKLIRECRSPQDWAILALQNVRTGKSQYLVICRCEQGELGTLCDIIFILLILENFELEI